MKKNPINNLGARLLGEIYLLLHCYTVSYSTCNGGQGVHAIDPNFACSKLVGLNFWFYQAPCKDNNYTHYAPHNKSED